jgi:large subunit ribosomal protein L4
MENKIFLERKKRAIGLIHRVYLTKEKNARIFSASTKTRSEVRGGGRKPWRQKGTGNARAGSTRSPLWVGGGVIFGPRPRKVVKKVNKKENRLAILSALFLKRQQVVSIEDSLLENSEVKKTKDLGKLLTGLGRKENEKSLVIVSKPNRNLWLACRNLPNLEITTTQTVNVSQLVKAARIFVSSSSFNTITEYYGKQYR